jgi:hypothetical protein
MGTDDGYIHVKRHAEKEWKLSVSKYDTVQAIELRRQSRNTFTDFNV